MMSALIAVEVRSMIAVWFSRSASTSDRSHPAVSVGEGRSCRSTSDPTTSSFAIRTSDQRPVFAAARFSYVAPVLNRSGAMPIPRKISSAFAARDSR
ncbi:hypothetical protein D3C74_270320 [compost metagenome]